MKIGLTSNIPEVQAALKRAASQVPYAASVAINATAELSRDAVQSSMRRVFDRPTPWVINSLRVTRSTKTNLTALLGFKDKNSVESARSMIEPHVFTGKRHFKTMEVRLYRAGLLPSGWNAVPGAAAKLDQFGNMSQGQITQLLNVLGTYTESGFNKAGIGTVKRLAKGNVKKNQYGFEYWINKVGSTRARHLPPGVFQRVKTGFGSSLKPILIFVRQAKYKQRLDFFGIAQKTIDREFAGQFQTAFDEAMRTALPGRA